MAVNPSSHCSPPLNRSLTPRSPLAFFNRNSSKPLFFAEAPAPRLRVVRSQKRDSDPVDLSLVSSVDGFGSKSSGDLDDTEGSIGSSGSSSYSSSRSSSSSSSTSSSIDFLTLCHSLKTTKRKGWINHGIKGPESIADHMYRMALMALIVGDLPGVNKERCIKIAIVHDIAEAIVGDITPSDGVPKAEKSRREQAALNEMCKVLGGGMRAEEIKELWAEYENNSSPEANLVKDFDKVEMILQALEYEMEHGKVLDEFFLSTADNPIANNPSPNAPENSGSAGNGSIGTGAAVAISMVVGFIVLSLIGLTVWCAMKRKRKVSGLNGGYVMPSPLGSSSKSDLSIAKAHSSAPLIGSGSGSDFVYSPREPGGSGGLGNSRPWFTYEELVVATNGFSDQNLLGEGGFGSVYKGYLPDGREVAVKQLKIGGGQGEREFKSEVEIISRIHHRHLVSLVGYCISENQRLLVYDYVPNNTLYFHLHGQGRPVMDWATRVKIAAGAARGIAYLHEDCHPRIIHRDIKSSNILLDNNFEARVSDFGLAKLALDAHTHITTRVMGTFGYMAPEYASSGKLTEKSDVYSFGVVLLELITGRKPVDASQPLGDESLVEWARPLLSHALDIEDFEGLADPRLEKNYVESEMFRMIEAAAACVRHSAAKRPRMGQVVRAFDRYGCLRSNQWNESGRK
ncbi:hypothetical protein L1049_007025 [Liquidambar formosana]|uniref:non-specific serine/threonine protein kinase n=1 Tax=Liquidambar formosana TaxID=63359 RepID=A0AAP0WUH3_LIQFO